MLFNSLQLSSFLIISGSLVGCTAIIKTPYETPTIHIPSSFTYDLNRVKSQQVRPYSERWWTLFGDQELSQLIDDVLAKNTDLAVARIAIKQAWLQANLRENQQRIRTNSSVSTGHRVNLNSGDNSSQGLSLSAGVSYELDLFGKLARQTETSRLAALATEQELLATVQTLVGTTSRLYWQLAYLNERLSTARQSLATSQKLYDIVSNQYKAGAVSGLDLIQAEQSVQSQRVNLNQINQNLVDTRTAIAVLLHLPVQQLKIKEPSRLEQIVLPSIEAGLPAEILSRRPDLRAAELRLRESLANKDAIKAGYYPSINLTGNLGSSSSSLTALLRNPALSLGTSLSLPFVQYNDMKKNIEISQLDYEKAIVQYRQTLYKSFADVEKALSAHTEFNHQVLLQQRNLELSEKLEHITELSYRNGAIALKNLLDQQETTRNIRLNFLSSKQNQYNAYVTLIQALGGSPVKTLPN